MIDSVRLVESEIFIHLSLSHYQHFLKNAIKSWIIAILFIIKDKRQVSNNLVGEGKNRIKQTQACAD